MNSATLYGRVTMDPAAFARFCETPSMAICNSGTYGIGQGQVDVDAGDGRIMLEARRPMIQNLRLASDLHKAAQAGRVDGAFMAAWDGEDRRLEAVVFRNSETWAGWTDCLADSVDIGPCTLRLVERAGGEPFELFQRVEGSATKHRVSTSIAFQVCDCAGYDSDDEAACRSDGELISDEGERVRYDGTLVLYDDDVYGRSHVATAVGNVRREDVERIAAEEVRFADGVPVADMATFMPPRETGQLEHALIAALGVVNAVGRVGLGRLAWNATGPGQQNMFRRWLETFEEATGERHVTWVPDLSDIGWRFWVDGPAATFNKRPVCTNPGVTQRGACPVFLVSDTATPDTIRVPAHVDNVSLSDATKLVADGADPAEMAEAVAVIAAITDPDRR